MNLHKTVRVLAIVGILAASAVVGGSARANHSTTFTDCSSASPGVPAEPTLTPPPVEGEATPPPEPQATPAPQNCMPSQGDRIWGSRTLQFGVTRNGENIDLAQLWIFSQEDAIPSAANGQAFTASPAGEGPSGPLYSFNWDSVAATPYNGIYKVVVRAHARARTLSSAHYNCADPTNNKNMPTDSRVKKCAERVDLRVDNPPKPVAAPRVLAATLGSVTLEWTQGSEPDITAYTVYRATTASRDVRPEYSAFRQVGVTSTPAFRDSTVQPGTNWYFIRVTRRSVVTPELGISSPASAMSAPAVIENPNKPPVKDKGDDDDNKDKTPTRFIPYRQLAPPRPRTVVRSVPDAPFAYKLPYDDAEGNADFGAIENGTEEKGPTDPRGAVLPVAVGMFLVSSALAVGRMPY